MSLTITPVKTPQVQIKTASTKENLDFLDRLLRQSQSIMIKASDALNKVMKGKESTLNTEENVKQIQDIFQNLIKLKLGLDGLEINMELLKRRLNIADIDYYEMVNDIHSDHDFEDNVKIDPAMFRPKTELKIKEEKVKVNPKKKSKVKVKVKVKPDFDVKSELPDTSQTEDQEGEQEDEMFICDTCGAFFEQEQKLMSHKEDCQSRGKLKCHSCNFTSISLSEIKKHMRSYHELVEVLFVTQLENQDQDDLYLCPRCSFENPCILNLQKHMKESHNKDIKIENKKERHVYGEFKCQFCITLDMDILELKRHMQINHGLGLVMFVTEFSYPHRKHYLCKKCNFSSTQQETIETHRHLVEEVKKEESPKEQADKEYCCMKCDYKTKQHPMFIDHIQGENQFIKCPFCDQHFSSKSLKMPRHIRTKHSHLFNSKLNSFVCPQCDIRLNTRKTEKYFSHLYTSHRIGTQYHCSLCEFSTGGNLNLIHKHRTSHDEAAYLCDHCSFKAKAKYRLNKHIYNVHTKFDCSKCDMVFKVKDELNLHLKDHEGLENSQGLPFCDHCGNFFHTPKQLLTHKQELRQMLKKEAMTMKKVSKNRC